MSDTQRVREPRPDFTDIEHLVLYNVVQDIRDDMFDLKTHVNDELEIQKYALAENKRALNLKADHKDITLWVMWQQSPVWLRTLTTITVISSGALAVVVPLLHLPTP